MPVASRCLFVKRPCKTFLPPDKSAKINNTRWSKPSRNGHKGPSKNVLKGFKSSQKLISSGQRKRGMEGRGGLKKKEGTGGCWNVRRRRLLHRRLTEAWTKGWLIRSRTCFRTMGRASPINKALKFPQLKGISLEMFFHRGLFFSIWPESKGKVVSMKILLSCHYYNGIVWGIRDITSENFYLEKKPRRFLFFDSCDKIVLSGRMSEWSG
ncbi:hypothetical protein CEXT_23601 [Caerostris extrusa]|uniref:Ribosomal protein L2 n=1 Tax=Caerostris extrusa TaxID=172846 RepID=A0AAV4P9J2_CAEEX|nr:hypothetical protein CEXT_23601 [Caerostris extrusa]